MMNIRDNFFINKAKSSNKIKILEILGFETDSFISQSSETIKYLSDDIGSSEGDQVSEVLQNNNLEYNIENFDNNNITILV